MEVEAWLLGLYTCFEGVDSVLTSTYIQEKLGINLEDNDPETTYFHPATEVKRIMELAGRSYGKSKGDINSIMGCLNRENFTELLALPKCGTFNIFHSACSED